MKIDETITKTQPRRVSQSGSSAPPPPPPASILSISKGGVPVPFPWKLHEVLSVTEEEGLDHIVSWQSHGRAFKVHNVEQFVEKVMKRFFGQNKWPSFQRQLNLYGFSRFAHGRDKGSYYHACFIKGQTQLVRGMVRSKVKGTKTRRTISEDEEPNFYLPIWKSLGGGAAAPTLIKENEKTGLPIISSSASAGITPEIVSEEECSGEDESSTDDSSSVASVETIEYAEDDFKMNVASLPHDAAAVLNDDEVPDAPAVHDEFSMACELVHFEGPATLFDLAMWPQSTPPLSSFMIEHRNYTTAQV